LWCFINPKYEFVDDTDWTPTNKGSAKFADTRRVVYLEVTRGGVMAKAIEN
jgi:hypothetical protein